MKAILSPAKKLNFDDSHEVKMTKPLLLKKTDILVKVMKEKSVTDIKKLMKLSDDLSELNYNRYQKYESSKKAPAAFAFVGDTYQGLDFRGLSKKQQEYANGTVYILSGLYGLLNVFDEISPYRLEMGTGLKFDSYKNLYDFWKNDIAKTINKYNSQNEPIVNLASEEYFKSVKREEVAAPIIDVKFLENKNGEFKTIGIMAKRARGMMARFIVENKVQTVEELQNFNVDNYKFDKKSSTENLLVFKR
ncbi:peroxide stress protein YaaA [Bacteriovorax sp. Seq25_V]|uniref:peroxide stress protein YaaA n=1 Tax=Bacteriovorax sp. Seq25_V TaxID=1201288 RepID=UPI000389ED5E|nr:peroxide stress protein YaaA [Bacteriovorax sp. Seq25_V]EQC44188.1 PF03883 family protein [Bacteriovorax sp. Seq25_V]